MRREGILSPTDHQTDSLPKQSERLTDEKNRLTDTQIRREEQTNKLYIEFYVSILLTERKNSTRRISAWGLDSTDWTHRASIKKEQWLIFSQYHLQQAGL